MDKKSLLNFLDAEFNISGVSDYSLNGLQVDNQNAEINKVAFAVDASLDTILSAASVGADMLFVHHGLFWGKPLAITGSHFKRIKALLDNNLALFALHLPLDLHDQYGNNIQIAKALKLENIQPFGEYHGQKIGFKGSFKSPQALAEVAATLALDEANGLKTFAFGSPKVSTVGIISGGASSDVTQAISENLDLYITGEFEHQDYNTAKEACINVISGGHYATETFGVRAVASLLATRFNLATDFINIPTSL